MHIERQALPGAPGRFDDGIERDRHAYTGMQFGWMQKFFLRFEAQVGRIVLLALGGALAGDFGAKHPIPRIGTHDQRRVDLARRDAAAGVAYQRLLQHTDAGQNRDRRIGANGTRDFTGRVAVTPTSFGNRDALDAGKRV